MTMIDKDGHEVQARPFTRWFQQMEMMIRNNPKRADEIDQENANAERKRLYMRYMRCGAPREALDSAGWHKFRVSANREINEAFQMARSYVSVITSDSEVQAMNGIVNKHSNLLVSGGHGSGKTFLALSIIRQLVAMKKQPRNYLAWDVDSQMYVEKPLYVDEYYECAYVKSPTMISELSTKDYTGSGHRLACWNTYSKVDFLVIDNCFGDGGYKERDELKIISQILDTRMDAGLPTAIITASADSNGVCDWVSCLGMGLFNKLRMQSLILDLSKSVDMRNPKFNTYNYNYAS